MRKKLLLGFMAFVNRLFGSRKVSRSNESAMAAADKIIELPPPDRSGGVPLMRALDLRQTTRSFSARPLALSDISSLLWAAWGINREDGRRTAPTGINSQQVNVYALLEDGVWLYDAASHSLYRLDAEDRRKSLGGPPLVLLYAAPDDKFSHMHVGSIYQNVSLYCASSGLAGGVRAIGAYILDNKLGLPEGYSIQIVHCIGYGKERKE